ncbi:sterol desaturase family protein [Caulobacter sp. 17J80-11]|uniref:sterol desaturase family protein n=1 Tax=Caulobacter sp. 17J80-11 TaxID=2763502 RepID=UPI0016538788|nr:sterol desaturase family protein [Caulobacter sp. 17J80-11]MBC6981263.1 sterol desaturase family protein [Caulobacter sp. 17J80-11]
MVQSKRSWIACIACGLGLMSLLGVLAFHFPALLTSQQFRAVYTEHFARTLLLTGLVAAFGLGTFAVLTGRDRKIALTGVLSAGLAVLLGGATVRFGPIAQTPFSLGLDWFLISLVISAIVFIPIERMMAVRPMSPLRPEWRTDMGYFFMSHMLIQFIFITVTASTATVAAFAAFPAVKAFLQGLPVWVQFLMCVFFADLFQAGLHRAYHKLGFLWRFHAVHHSSRHMDWLAGSRVHLVEIVLTRCAVLLPLVVLGFSAEAVNAYVVLAGVQAVVAHANLKLDFGWLEYVVCCPRYHHWHHARDEAYVDANYAIHLPLIDMLMGTFRRPPAGTWPEEYGVMELESVPSGFVAQHAMPFGKQQTFERYVGGEA